MPVPWTCGISIALCMQGFDAIAGYGGSGTQGMGPRQGEAEVLQRQLAYPFAVRTV